MTRIIVRYCNICKSVAICGIFAAMTSTIDTALKTKGYSSTRVRRRVFEALDNNEPQTMREIISQVHGVDRASVYRTILLFEKLGIVHRIQQGWKYKLELTDQFHPHHHHLSCTNCGKSIDIKENPDLEKLLLKLAAAENFKPSAHQLEIQGLCQSCRTVHN